MGLCITGLMFEAGCRSDPFTEAQVLAGKTVPAATLNKGAAVYRRFCARCHGSRGNGLTTAMRRDRPPRDLTSGHYKYTSVSDGLPTDDDLRRTIRRGLGEGKVMPAYPGLDADELNAVVQFVKTFAERWRDGEVGTVIKFSADPWTDAAAAVAHGRSVYHTVTQCWACHPAYVGREKLTDMYKRVAKPLPSLRGDLSKGTVDASRYGRLRAPDFRGDVLANGTARRDLYRAIAAGLGGTKMPSWDGSVSPRDTWAIVYYLRSLIEAGN